MKRQTFLGERVPTVVFAHWRGRPMYILLVYLMGQILIDPPAFLLSILFISYVTQIEMRDFIAPVALLIGGLIAFAYILYYVFSHHTRRFLRVLIAGDLPDAGLALQAWRETAIFALRVILWFAVTSLVIYAIAAVAFTPRFGFSASLVGSAVGVTASIALAQIVYLAYLQWALEPVTRLALAAGARPGLSDLRAVRFRLHTKLLLLILFVVVVPLTAMATFGYGQVLALGGDPTRSLYPTLLIAALAGGIAVLLVLFLIRSLLAPIREMQRVVDEIGRGNLDAAVRPLTTDEISELGLHFNEMIVKLRQQEEIKAAFGRYVSEAVRDGILSGQIALGGERRDLTVLFTDIRNFTAWCEETLPETVIQTLNSYYENLIQALVKHGGTVTRYTGDGVLALFGAPLEEPHHALRAVQAAWEAQTLLEKFNAIRRSVGAFELHTGFGIHSGVAVVGSIGCEARAEYTPIGDAANVASRIEGLNRDLGTAILISEETFRRVNGHVVTGKQAETPVKGRTRPVRVIEVIGLRQE